MSKPLPLPDGYTELLEQIKDRIRAVQVRAALSTNRELVLLYWHVGNEILVRQKTAGWGAKVIDRLSADLRREFPDMRGFSPRNLKNMRALAEAWPDVQIVQQAVAQIPWGHNVHILDKLDTPEARLTETLPAELAGNLPTIDELEAEFDPFINDPGESPDQSQ